jgi:hypothetical protein
MSKIYDILLNDIKIGTTELEHADVPMGVVFGRINFVSTQSGYGFFLEYCLKNSIEFQHDAETRLIQTRSITGLRILDTTGYEIKGKACSISGMDDDGFEVYVEAVPFPFYSEEFQHHVIADQKRFLK